MTREFEVGDWVVVTVDGPPWRTGEANTHLSKGYVGRVSHVFGDDVVSLNPYPTARPRSDQGWYASFISIEHFKPVSADEEKAAIDSILKGTA